MKIKLSLLILIIQFLVFSEMHAQQWGDYTLYSIMNSNSAVLVDNNGNNYKTWSFTNAQTAYSSYLTPGGDVWRAVKKTGNSFTGGGISGRVTKHSYNGTLLWDFTYSTTNYCLHHDICPLPNGNVLLIAYERKTAAEAVAAGCAQSIEIWSEKIIEVQQTGLYTGNVVWEWKLWDHLVQSHDPTKANYQTSIVNNPHKININYQIQKDWVHMNGIDYNPLLDQIVVSSHNLNEIWVIDHSTTTAEAAGSTGGLSGRGGDILYRWGNPAAYGASGTKIINVGHDAHWVPDGCPNAGRLVVFNNKGVSNTQSSVDQIQPPINGYTYDINIGNAYSPASYTSRLNCNGVSQGQSNSQQLPNGNNLVCMANSGLIYETNPQGVTIWTKQLSGQSVQAFRYAACYLNYPAPPIPVITENNGVLTSSTATTYQWYRNGVLISGADQQSFSPTQSGGYIVRTTDQFGCVYQYSTTLVYDYTVSVNDFQNNNFSSRIFPNPGCGRLETDIPDGVSFEAEVYDITGKQILKQYNNRYFSLECKSQGIYFVKIKYENGFCENHKYILH